MTTVVKGKVLEQDKKHWDGVTRLASRKDATGGTIVGNSIGAYVDVLEAYGDSTNYTWQTVSDCTRRIGSTSVTLLFKPGTWTIDQDLTIASNFTSRIPNGVIFDVSSGKTLTFSGPVIRDSNTWTSGSGTVTESGTRFFSGLIDLSGAVLQGGTPLVFEGATADAFETSLAFTDPTADRTITVPNQTGTLCVRETANAGPIDLSLSFSVASSALTCNVLTRDGITPSASRPVSVPMRNATAATGDYNVRNITAATSLTISSGSVLGHNSAIKQYIYWYLIDNAGTVELAASSKFFGNHGIVSTTAEGGAGAADSGTVMYSTTARASVPFICIGYTEDTQTTAGTWAAVPSTVHLAPFSHPVISFSVHKNGTNQTGVVTATATLVTFSTEVYDNGSLFSSSQWTPPPGKILLTAAGLFSATVDVTLLVSYIYKNGAEFKQEIQQSSGTGNQGLGICIEDECNGTDVYAFRIRQDSGSDQVIAGSSVSTYFMGSWSPQRS